MSISLEDRVREIYKDQGECVNGDFFCLVVLELLSEQPGTSVWFHNWVFTVANNGSSVLINGGNESVNDQTVKYIRSSRHHRILEVRLENRDAVFTRKRQ